MVTTIALEELRMATTMLTSPKDQEKREHAQTAVNVRQLAELAAAAAHRKSLDQDEVLGGGDGRMGMKSPNPSSRRGVTRRSSCGVPSRTNSGLRGMTRHSFGSSERTMLSRTSSMHVPPSSRGIHRTASSDVSPMLSRSYTRSGSLHREPTTPSADANHHGGSGAGLHDRSSPDRGLRRAQSSKADFSFPSPSMSRHAPERRSLMRSDSARATPSRRGVGRTCSQNSLNHMSQNGTDPSAAEVGTLRPYRGREGLVNTSIQRSDSITSRSQQLSMLRRSIDDRSVGDLSSFTMATMDSVNLRKQQIVADPIDDAATYMEDASFADHDSVSMATHDFAEHIPERNPNHIPYDGASVAESSQVSGMDSLPASSHHLRQPSRVLEDMKYLEEEEDTCHSRPNQINCDTVSLSTIGGELDENDESSYLEDDDFDTTLHEDIDELDEDDDDDLDDEK